MAKVINKVKEVTVEFLLLLVSLLMPNKDGITFNFEHMLVVDTWTATDWKQFWQWKRLHSSVYKPLLQAIEDKAAEQLDLLDADSWSGADRKAKTAWKYRSIRRKTEVKAFRPHYKEELEELTDDEACLTDYGKAKWEGILMERDADADMCHEDTTTKWYTNDEEGDRKIAEYWKKNS